MAVLTLQKELKKIVQKEERVVEELRRILARIEKSEADLPYGDWELKPVAMKRVERARKIIAAGKGRVLKNEEELRSFFRSMRHGG